MAKIILNPMFSEAEGNLGRIVLYKRNGVQCARKYVVPRNPDTHAQRSNRSTFAMAVKAWKNLSQDNKNEWNSKAQKKGKTGYNYFLSQYMKKSL